MGAPSRMRALTRQIVRRAGRARADGALTRTQCACGVVVDGLVVDQGDPAGMGIAVAFVDVDEATRVKLAAASSLVLLAWHDRRSRTARAGVREERVAETTVTQV
jgi:hypothetical protein